MLPTRLGTWQTVLPILHLSDKKTKLLEQNGEDVGEYVTFSFIVFKLGDKDRCAYRSIQALF